MNLQFPPSAAADNDDDDSCTLRCPEYMDNLRAEMAEIIAENPEGFSDCFASKRPSEIIDLDDEETSAASTSATIQPTTPSQTHVLNRPAPPVDALSPIPAPQPVQLLKPPKQKVPSTEGIQVRVSIGSNVLFDVPNKSGIIVIHKETQVQRVYKLIREVLGGLSTGVEFTHLEYTTPFVINGPKLTIRIDAEVRAWRSAVILAMETASQMRQQPYYPELVAFCNTTLKPSSKGIYSESHC